MPERCLMQQNPYSGLEAGCCPSWPGALQSLEKMLPQELSCCFLIEVHRPAEPALQALEATRAPPDMFPCKCQWIGLQSASPLMQPKACKTV